MAGLRGATAIGVIIGVNNPSAKPVSPRTCHSAQAESPAGPSRRALSDSGSQSDAPASAPRTALGMLRVVFPHEKAPARGQGLWVVSVLISPAARSHEFQFDRRSSLAVIFGRGIGLMQSSTTAIRTAPPGAVPQGWGSDELTKFWDAARQNQFGTFARKQPLYKRSSDIDALFVRVSKDWLNPDDEIAAMLLLRCHSAFRTAAGLAAAGQAAETYVMNRAVLENAAYALHLHRDTAVRMIWLDRHQSDAALKASRDALTHAKVLATVTAVNQHAAKRFEELYQRAIDFGGHPNERSVTGNMKMVDEPNRRVMLAVMQHADGPELNMALKTTAQCGMCALEMLQGVFNARFELLGINAAMLELRKGL
jgi:hypothetical protein